MQRSTKGSRKGAGGGAAKENHAWEYADLRAKYLAVKRSNRAYELSAQHLAAEQERLRTIGGLAFGVAHDANNLLAALKLRVGILLKDPVCTSAQLPNLEAIDRILRQGTVLLAKLQNCGRSGEPAIGPVNLDEIIRAAVEIAQSGLRLRAAETGVSLRIRCELEAVPEVRGLDEELRHVFVNLLINARDAMPRGGTILVRSRRDGDGVVVTVEDEGTGIPDPLLPRIFERFFTTKGNHGSGMGLALAKNVMDRIDSTIEARNRPQGGACFELRFARFEPRAARRPATRAGGGARTPLWLRQTHGSSRRSDRLIST